MVAGQALVTPVAGGGQGAVGGAQRKCLQQGLGQRLDEGEVGARNAVRGDASTVWVTNQVSRCHDKLKN